MPDSKYHYVPLRPQIREIRLLTLQPDTTPDQTTIPRCRLSSRSLDDQPAYSALSYVWGDAASSRAPENVIELDGQRFAVTANLLSALRHLRPRAPADQPLTLWVDAVCINQDDLDERSQQVSMMRDIYASAKRVIIWLGEGDDGSDGAFETIQEIAATSAAIGGPGSDGGGDDEKEEEKKKKKERQLHLMRSCSSFLFNIAENRPWFYRVWILQELAMAQEDPLVVCGWRSVPWSVLVSTWKAIAREVFTEIGMVRLRDGRRDSSSGDLNRNPERIPNGDDDGAEAVVEQQEEPEIVQSKLKIDVLDELLHQRRSNGGASLRKLLLISRTSKATDPRDRIYALLGMMAPRETAAESGSVPIHVDYRKPTWEVYSDAVSHIFSRGEGPYFLAGVFLQGERAAAPQPTQAASAPAQPPGDAARQSPHVEPCYLPSWVPDFSRQTADATTKSSGMAFHPPACRSASGAGAMCMNGWRMPDKRTLKVHGLVVDVIEEVIPMGKSLAETIRLLPRLESLTRSARHRRPSSCFQDPESTMNVDVDNATATAAAALIEQFKHKEPLWRTLICNKLFFSGYDEAPASYQDLYLRILQDGEATLGSSSSIRSEYERSLEEMVGHRVFLTTKSGFVGTCVPDGRPGDVIAIWFGSPVPFVLRATAAAAAPGALGTEPEGRVCYSLIGAAYVGGIMGGEMVDELYCEDLMGSTTFYVQ